MRRGKSQPGTRFLLRRLRIGALFASHLLFSASLIAAPPTVPLPSLFYSFDLSSPAVMNTFVEADDVLALNLPYPLPVVPAGSLGLGAAGDDLDALSGGHKLFSSEATFALRFSVTRESTGNVPPEPALIALSVPYNVMDQAGRGHQAGDEYLSLRVFNLSGSMDRPAATYDNHTMVENNYDEGGSDYAARPETHANSMSVGQPQDNVDALAHIDAGAAFYYSVTSASPSLSSLPGSANPSGAHIFRLALTQISLYASFTQLGLQQADDVDALVVFDINADGIFNGLDRVLFSLTPGSPSLATIPGASANAAADVFVVRPGQAPELFTSAASLGLVGESDDIDALEILVCSDATACASAHGIRSVQGDFDDDGDVDDSDLETFDDCYRGQGEPYEPGCESGDFDSDSDIDCGDATQFVLAWDGAGSPGVPTACRGSIPAVSEWGAVIMALAMAVAGSILLRRPQRCPQSFEAPERFATRRGRE
jgi:hypothetical protein